MQQLLNDEFKAVHCIGNGKVCTYFRGPEIIQMFGPNYSTPNALSMKMVNGGISFEAQRITDTAIWNHKLYEFNCSIGEVTDFTAKDSPVMIRDMNFDKIIEWDIISDNLINIKKLPSVFNIENDCLIGEIKEGSSFYSNSNRNFISSLPFYFAVLATGDISLASHEDKIKCISKKGILYFMFARNFDELVGLIEKVTSTGMRTLYDENKAAWEEFSSKRRANVPVRNPEYEIIADDIATLIKTQQSVTGGVLAGYNYHLAYIRDNYGTLRGLLSLGCYDEAKLLIMYYIDIFARYGEVHNAQGTDLFAFHIHENDSVEITGYMILMGIDYHNATKDFETLEKMVPLMSWCIMQQHGFLRRGMLPFNGDETYIAGGILPRTAINDGSMEASLLYNESCKALIALSDRLSLIPDILDVIKEDSRSIEDNFKANFIVDGKLACNNPDYYEKGETPKSRFGVTFCGHGMNVSFRNDDGAYLCIDCIEKDFPQYRNSRGKVYFINSVVLMPAFINSDLIEESMMTQITKGMIEQVIKENKMPSGLSSNLMVGYDYGLLIFAAKMKKLPHIEELTRRMIALRDSTGAFVEYYADNKPVGTMCRPWESGINITALLEM
ncbi:MAG: hypothetical protein ACYCYI_08620 [Saccharofermentanales bacterium]